MYKQTVSLRMLNPGKLFFVLLASFLMTGLAATAQTVALEKSIGEAAVRHQGSIGNKEYFSIAIPNEKGEKFSILVKDEKGAIVFNDVFQVKNFKRSFQFEKLVNKSKLTFIIRTLRDNSEQVFEVNSKVFTVEQVEITKAK
jgi:hypothetical protein